MYLWWECGEVRHLAEGFCDLILNLNERDMDRCCWTQCLLAYRDMS
jgi:hypothetical protein